MKKKSLFNLIDILTIIYIIIGVLHFIITECSEDWQQITTVSFKDLISSIPLLIVVGICVVVFKNFTWFAIYLGIRIATRNHLKDKLNENKFFRNKSYYRDIIDKYNVGMLSYIDDFKVDENTVIATLLSLELKKKIKIQDKIQLIDDSLEGLEESEIYVLNHIKNNNFKQFDIQAYENNVVQECKKYELLEEKQVSKNKIKKKLFRNIIIVVLMFIALLNVELVNLVIEKYPFLGNFLVIVVLILFILMVMSPIMIISNIISYLTLNMIDPYVRNKTAKELNENLEGLKNYLQDYSKMSERGKEDLVLWEEYLVYSVLFGQNKNVVEEIKSKL